MESLLVRPLIPPSWGIVEGYVVGVIHPWGMGIPCRFVSRSKPTTIEYTGASVSQPPITTYIFQYFLSNLIPGGIIWVVSWWLWFISTDKRGKAHPLCSGNNQRQKQGRDHHSFLVPIDEFFMKQPHDMLIEGNHEKLYPEKSSGNIRLNQLSVVWFFIWSINGQEEQDGKQTRFFWIFVNFSSASWRKY